MRLIPLILNWPESPLPVTTDLQRAAGALAWDAKLLLDRQTGMSMHFKRMQDNRVMPPWASPEGDYPDRFAEVVEMGIPFPRDAQDEALWTRQGRVNQTDDDWFNISRHLVDVHGYDWEQDVFLCWINGHPSDYTGIGGPAWDTTPPIGRWNETRDPDLGGVALNGRAQLERYIESGGRGTAARQMALYAGHELGHALGEQHSGYEAGKYPTGRPRDRGFLLTLMGYGYSQLAAGLPDIRYGFEYQAGLLLPEQQLRLRAHAAFEPLPDYEDEDDAGVVDSVVLRKDGLLRLFADLPELAGREAAHEIIARINVGPTQAER